MMFCLQLTFPKTVTAIYYIIFCVFQGLNRRVTESWQRTWKLNIFIREILHSLNMNKKVAWLQPLPAVGETVGFTDESMLSSVIV